MRWDFLDLIPIDQVLWIWIKIAYPNSLWWHTKVQLAYGLAVVGP